MAPKNQTPDFTPDVTPVEFTPGEPLKPNTVSVVKPKLMPADHRMKDVHVQNDWFVRQNLEKDDPNYRVPQYIEGFSPDGTRAIVENPEYDPRMDKTGTLRVLPLSKGPKVGANGELLPARYAIAAKAPAGTQQEPREHTKTMWRQDN